MESFFDVSESEKHANKLEAYLEPRPSTLRFQFNKKIVDVIISDMLLPPNAQESTSLFVFDADHEEYTVEVNQVKQFELAVRFAGHGMSFRMAAEAIQDAKQILTVLKLGFCNELHVAKYVRIACAASFQAIMDALTTCWSFSVAFDGSTDIHGTSFIDVRVRFFQAAKIHNLHVIAVPFEGRHSGAAMFEMFTKLFQAFCPDWPSKLIGCSTDGAANMTGSISGVVTRIQQEITNPGFIRVWWLLHQIDIVLQKAFNSIDEGRYLKILTSLVSHLRKQKLFCDKIQAVCPLLSATRWVSMSRVSRFLLEHRADIFDHFDRIEEEGGDSIRFRPEAKWWILLAAVADISTQVNLVVQTLQGKTETLSTQTHEVDQLIANLKRCAFVEGPMSSPEFETNERAFDFIIGCWGFSKEELSGFLKDQGIFVFQSLQQLSNLDAVNVCQLVAEFLSFILEGLVKVSAVRGEAADYIHPPTLPQEILALKPRDVAELVMSYHSRLMHSWDASKIDRIVEQHKLLIEANRLEPRLPGALAKLGALRLSGSLGYSWTERSFPGVS